MAWIGTGIAGATALIKGVTGAVQNSEANAIDKNNPYPTMTVQPEYEKNVRQAEQMSQTGIPQQAYNNQTNGIARNQAAGLAALSRSANPAAGVASTVRAGNDATGNLNAQDALQRNRNLLNLLQERRILAGQKDKAWDWNFQQKYLGNLAKSQALKASGNANISGALSDAAGIGTAVAYGGGTDGETVNPAGEWGNMGGYRYRDGSVRPSTIGSGVGYWGGQVGG